MGVGLQHRLDIRARRRSTDYRSLRRRSHRTAGKERGHGEPIAPTACGVVTGETGMDYRKNFMIEPSTTVVL